MRSDLSIVVLLFVEMGSANGVVRAMFLLVRLSNLSLAHCAWTSHSITHFCFKNTSSQIFLSPFIWEVWTQTDKDGIKTKWREGQTITARMTPLAAPCCQLGGGLWHDQEELFVHVCGRRQDGLCSGRNSKFAHWFQEFLRRRQSDLTTWTTTEEGV